MGELFDRALAFAIKKHKGQTRWDKKTPYIVHPIAVSSTVREAGWPEWVQAVAVLHDTLEDTDVTPGELDKLFGTEICTTVQTLSRFGNTTYHDYILSIRGNRAAVAVKLADLDHNLRDLKHGSLRDKYKLAQYVLDPPNIPGKTRPNFPSLDWIYYLEMALTALDVHSDTLATVMDLSDGELDRLHKQLYAAMNKKGPNGRLPEEHLPRGE